jgi:hypothetical protein
MSYVGNAVENILGPYRMGIDRRVVRGVGRGAPGSLGPPVIKGVSRMRHPAPGTRPKSKGKRRFPAGMTNQGKTSKGNDKQRQEKQRQEKQRATRPDPEHDDEAVMVGAPIVM